VIKAALVALGVLVAIGVVVTAAGYALPRDHTASRAARFAEPPEKVFAVLQDIERYPAWRSDVEAVEVLARAPATRWRERGGNGTITFEMEDAQSPSRMVTRIADASLPFGGRWTYLLTREGSGTNLTITEQGEVYNPVFRFMSRFVFGHSVTIDRFLDDLGERLKKG
jgi:uncharacterized protein YndB with AHSA1/START domain